MATSILGRSKLRNFKQIEKNIGKNSVTNYQFGVLKCDLFLQ